MTMKMSINSIKLTFRAESNFRNVIFGYPPDGFSKHVRAAEHRACGTNLGTSTSKHLPIKMVAAIARDPIELLSPFMKNRQKVNADDCAFLRMRQILLNRAISKLGVVTEADMTISLNDFSTIQQTLLLSKEPYDIPQEFETNIPSRKRYRPSEDDEDDDHNGKKSHERGISSAIIPVDVSFIQAIDLVRKSLPLSLRGSDFVEYATRRAMGLRSTAEEFYEWVDQEAQAAVAATVAQAAAAATVAQAESESRKIRECDVRLLVDEVFESRFDAPCVYECGGTISLDRFYVVRDGCLFNACCSKCYRREVKAGMPGKKRITECVRRETWRRHNGTKVRGPCFHCGARGDLIHFYLDTWHAGHDLAAARGGEREPLNMAPLHPRCNWDQGTKAFDEY